MNYFMRGSSGAWVHGGCKLWPTLTDALRAQSGKYVFIYDADTNLTRIIELAKVDSSAWSTYSDLALLILRNLERYSLPIE